MEGPTTTRGTTPQGIPFEAENITAPTGRTRKVMYSKWHLLLNSNVPGTELLRANQISDELKSALRCAFKDNAEKVFTVKEGDKFDADTIISIKLQYAGEIGTHPMGGRVHVHAILSVEHYTILKIDYNAAHDIIYDCIQDPAAKRGFYFRLWFIPSTQPLENYLGKDPLNSNFNMQDLLNSLPKPNSRRRKNKNT